MTIGITITDSGNMTLLGDAAAAMVITKDASGAFHYYTHGLSGPEASYAALIAVKQNLPSEGIAVEAGP